jgi:MOSC domain-containing protein YiiM
MRITPSPAVLGHVASLHLHPPDSGAPLLKVDVVEAVQAKGIVGDARFFGRLSRETGQPTRRQVSLIEREQIASHATALLLPSIAPGAVRSNIETSGVDLISLLGQEVEIGEVVLRICIPRTPCPKMDAICQGLRELMLNERQGVMAEVLRSGKMRVGDPIRLWEQASAPP